MVEKTFSDVTIKRLQLISGLIDVLVDLIAQGAHVSSDQVTNILHSLISAVNEVMDQIEDQKDDNAIKDRSGDGSHVDTSR